jgi:uncharacterized protein with HEPN domain
MRRWRANERKGVAMASDDHYLTCMNQCMGHILQVAPHGLSSLMDSIAVRDATLWNIHLVSYAARQLSDEKMEMHPEIDWQALRDLSHSLIGDPWSVDLGSVASYVEDELPEVRDRLQRLMGRRLRK